VEQVYGDKGYDENAVYETLTQGVVRLLPAMVFLVSKNIQV